MNIRQGTKEDIPFIVEFNKAMALETETKVLNNHTLTQGVTGLLNNPNNGFYLIAEKNDIPRGQLMITKEWSDWRNGIFWWIQSVYIPPNHRKEGIYKTLHKEVRRLANLEGNICGIRLYVDQENKNAKKVYIAMGMIETDYQLYEEDWS